MDDISNITDTIDDLLRSNKRSLNVKWRVRKWLERKNKRLLKNYHI